MPTEDPTKKREDEITPTEGADAEAPVEAGAPEVQGKTPERSEREEAQAEVVRDWIKEKLRLGNSIEEVEASFLYPTAIEYEVFEEFAPVGGSVRSYSETAKVNNNEISVGFNHASKSYDISANKGTEMQAIKVHTMIPEVAEMVFDHTIEAGNKYGDMDNPEALTKEARGYTNEIVYGAAFEPGRDSEVLRNYGEMQRRLEELEAKGKEIAEKFGPEKGKEPLPEEIRQAAAEKRAQIIEEWKQQLAELQKKDQIDKIKKSIGAI